MWTLSSAIYFVADLGIRNIIYIRQINFRCSWILQDKKGGI